MVKQIARDKRLLMFLIFLTLKYQMTGTVLKIIARLGEGFSVTMVITHICLNFAKS